MNQRQYRMHSAGLLLIRASSLLGGTLGVFVLLTVMTGEQRIACAFAIGALALPLALLAITIRSTGLDHFCLAGVALMSAVAFVEFDAYLALLTVALIGAGLVGAVKAIVAARPADRLG